ncbi:CHASE domain-containing protein [Cytophaga sp. FL35]|uniref:CHASE domain-containing protein n=1 Tax=Cytophaga sp. FL35 TaxID=1904456 RepID=UPI001653B5D6|nr:CHASE domain-containing protein [Cytophaga sp. FL35]MBC6997777.1 CHASE domain-containing protein [Cytophaga sp. FL35]
MNQKALLTKQEAVNNAISRSLIKIEDEINKINLVMESMNFFFENHEDVSQELFERFTDPYLMELRNIGALEWAPRIDTVAKNETTEDIPDITTTDTEGNFVTVDSKSVHYPIVLLNPLEPLKDALGFDNYSETTRKTAIDLAISSNQTTITAPVQLVQKNNGLPGFLAIKAVKNPKTKETKGIVAAIYRMDIFINRTLKNELPLMHMALTDSAAQSSPLFSNFKDSSQTIVNKKSIIKSVKASNRVWNVHFLPKRDYFAYPHVPESYIILLLGILTTGLILYTIKKNDEYHDRLEARVQIRTSELEASNKMKENLLREIHHRVKNNLQITSSLMNMQKRKLVSKEAITALSDSQARISAIALTHQKIYQDKDSKAVNLHDYLVDLMEYQKKISPSFTYKIDCPYVSVDLDRAVPLALIISELVTNAVKHAYPDTTKYNELSIDVSRIDEENVFLSIRDNGKGLPEGFELEQAEGIGFEIIRALCRQITATLTYASTEEGTQFDLKFKNLS